MHIEWSIDKKRGYLRPVLSYIVSLEEHEKDLAIPEVRILSSIPKPDDTVQRYCYPGRMERAEGWKPASFYELETPSHKGSPFPHTLVLPWREDNAYPEVEASFERLRRELEAELARAAASLPLHVKRSLRASLPGKVALAPSVAAEKLLGLAGRMGASAAGTGLRKAG